jgi:3-deoxy-manno-octulosonate cytidylyltransferase (CMP-KDO synthetase)
MTAVGIIPARYSASRFAGKPLAKIAGIPMIQRVWQGAMSAQRLRTTIVATDDDRIADSCRSFGAEVAMTRADHQTGTDRLAEVAAELTDDIIVNIQGDEPLIEGWIIDAAVDALIGDPEVSMSTVVHPAEAADVADPNRVKVVLDRSGRALYFSRSVIPAVRDGQTPPQYWQHVGLYAYRRPFLLQYIDLDPSPAEVAEQLEQLRALENGHLIRCVTIDGWKSTPVDVPDDIQRVESTLRDRAEQP